MEIEERKDGARMIGVGPHLLLFSSPGTLAPPPPPGNTPVSGQQPVGTGSPALLTALLHAQSPGSPKDFLWSHEGDSLEEGPLGIPELLMFLPPLASGHG